MFFILYEYIGKMCVKQLEIVKISLEKRNLFLIDPIVLSFKLGIILVLQNARFLLIFRAIAPKHQKLRFLRNLSIFVTLCKAISVSRKKGDLNQNLSQLFQKMNHHIKIFGVKKTTRKHFGSFLTHICEKGPKELIF